EAIAVDALPLILPADGGVHDHGMAVQLRLGRARQIMPEHRRHHRPSVLLGELALLTRARRQRILLQPAERLLDRGVVRCDQPLVATDEGSQTDTLWCGEGQIPAMPMLALLAGAATEQGVGLDPALEQLLEPAG